MSKIESVEKVFILNINSNFGFSGNKGVKGKDIGIW